MRGIAEAVVKAEAAVGRGDEAAAAKQKRLRAVAGVVMAVRSKREFEAGVYDSQALLGLAKPSEDATES